MTFPIDVGNSFDALAIIVVLAKGRACIDQLIVHVTSGLNHTEGTIRSANLVRKYSQFVVSSKVAPDEFFVTVHTAEWALRFEVNWPISAWVLFSRGF